MRHTPCKAIVNIRHRQQPVNGCQYRRWIQGIGKSVISLNIEVRVNQLLVAVAFLIAITSSAYSGLTHAVQEQQRQGQELVTTYQLNLPAQPLAAALNTLSEQTELQVLFPYDIVRSHSIKPLRGRYTIQQALSTMLHNTGLYGGLANSGVITIFADDLNQNGKGKRNMNSKKKLLASTIAFFMGSAVQGLVAQEEVGGQEENGWALEEVVVTAQKREERLLDVPMSISAVGEDNLERLQIKNINDLALSVPSLIVKEESSAHKVIAIRGIGNGSGVSPLVGVYLDEIPLSVDADLNVDLQTHDIERVEVLKGPQGTLFGQGAVGGAIRFLSNKPGLENIGGEVNVSHYNTERGSDSDELAMVINVPVVKDSLAFRVAAVYRNMGGWFELVDSSGSILESDINNNELSNIRVKGLWVIADNLEIDMMAVRHRSHAGGWNHSNLEDVTKSQYVIVDRNDLGTPSTDIPYEYDLYNFTITYDFDFATLTSSSSFYEVEHFAPLSVQLPTTDLYGETFSEGEVWSQEIRLTGHSSSDLDWVVGISHTDFDKKAEVDSQFYLGGVNLFGLVQEIDRSSQSTALFADMTYNATEKLSMGIGIRSFKDDRSEASVISGAPIGKRSAEFDKISLKGTLSYALNDDANIYASVSEGFRSGGFNTFVDTTYEPEEVISFEIGTKASLLDGILAIDAAIYHAKYTDYQSAEFDNSTGQNITRNPGEAEIQGLEFAAQLRVSKRITIGVNGNVTDAEFVKVAPNVLADPTATPPILGFTSQVSKGDSVNFVAKHSYSISADYKFNWFSSFAEGAAHIDYTRQGPSTFTDRAAVTESFDGSVESPSVGFLNAYVEAKWEVISVRLFGRNLNNEIRETNANTIFLSQNRPRTIGVDFNYRF